jgi:hypothetical protein
VLDAYSITGTMNISSDHHMKRGMSSFLVPLSLCQSRFLGKGLREKISRKQRMRVHIATLQY